MTKRQAKEDKANNKSQNDTDFLAREMRKMEQRLDQKIDSVNHELTTQITEVKDDVAKVKDDVAKVKDDVAKVKDDVSRVASDVVKELDSKLEAYVEIRKTDLLGVSSDEVSLLQNKVENHEERIASLESR